MKKGNKSHEDLRRTKIASLSSTAQEVNIGKTDQIPIEHQMAHCPIRKIDNP